jgi:hypothetical protein
VPSSHSPAHSNPFAALPSLLVSVLGRDAACFLLAPGRRTVAGGHLLRQRPNHLCSTLPRHAIHSNTVGTVRCTLDRIGSHRPGQWHLIPRPSALRFRVRVGVLSRGKSFFVAVVVVRFTGPSTSRLQTKKSQNTVSKRLHVASPLVIYRLGGTDEITLTDRPMEPDMFSKQSVRNEWVPSSRLERRTSNFASLVRIGVHHRSVSLVGSLAYHDTRA